MFGRATITLGIGPHSSYCLFPLSCFSISVLIHKRLLDLGGQFELYASLAAVRVSIILLYGIFSINKLMMAVVCSGQGLYAANLHKRSLSSSDKCACGMVHSITHSECLKTTLPDSCLQRLDSVDNDARNWMERTAMKSLAKRIRNKDAK